MSGPQKPMEKTLVSQSGPNFPQKRLEWSGVTFSPQVTQRPSPPKNLSLNLLKYSIFIIKTHPWQGQGLVGEGKGGGPAGHYPFSVRRFEREWLSS